MVTRSVSSESVARLIERFESGFSEEEDETLFRNKKPTNHRDHRPPPLASGHSPPPLQKDDEKNGPANGDGDKRTVSAFSPISVMVAGQQEQQHKKKQSQQPRYPQEGGGGYVLPSDRRQQHHHHHQHHHHPYDRSSPHTFASMYDDELWNAAGAATTSEEEEDDNLPPRHIHRGSVAHNNHNDDDDDDDDGNYSTSSASSSGNDEYRGRVDRQGHNGDATDLNVPRRDENYDEYDDYDNNDDDDDDDCSSLSSNTRSIGGLIAIGIPDSSEPSADSPPKPPERTPTLEDATQQAVSHVVAQNMAEEEIKLKTRSGHLSKMGDGVTMRKRPPSYMSVSQSSGASSKVQVLRDPSPAEPPEAAFGVYKRRLSNMSLSQSSSGSETAAGTAARGRTRKRHPSNRSISDSSSGSGNLPPATAKAKGTLMGMAPEKESEFLSRRRQRILDRAAVETTADQQASQKQSSSSTRRVNIAAMEGEELAMKKAASRPKEGASVVMKRKAPPQGSFQTQQSSNTITTQQSSSSALQACLAARSMHRGTSVNTLGGPRVMSHSTDRAASKMPLDEDGGLNEEDQDAPRLAATFRKKSPSATMERPALSSNESLQKNQARRSERTTLPRAMIRSINRAAAKATMDESSEDDCEALGPQLAVARKRPPSTAAKKAPAQQRKAPPPPPRMESHSRDPAYAKSAGNLSEEDEGPQLAQPRIVPGPIKQFVPISPRRDSSRTGSGGSIQGTQSIRSHSTKRSHRKIAAGQTDSIKVGSPILRESVPGVVPSKTDPSLERKIGEFVLGNHDDDDEGPQLALPVATAQARSKQTSAHPALREGIDEETKSPEVDEEDAPSFVGFNEYSADDEYTIEEGTGSDEEEALEVQAGLVVAGAWAIQGMDASTDETEDLHHEGIDPTASSTFQVVPEVEANYHSDTDSSVANENSPIAAPLEAELYEQQAICVDLYVDPDDIEDDPKLQQRLRIIRATILCSSMAGIAFVILSILIGFSQENVNITGPATISGWNSVGGTIFGPDFEQSQVLLGSAVALSKNGTRIATSAPGKDNGVLLDVGAVHLWDEDVTNGDNTTWRLTKTLNGPGPSANPSSPFTMSADGSGLAIGYPFFLSGEVRIYNEAEIWEEYISLTLEENHTNTGSAWFGYAVDFSQTGEYLAVGAPLDLMTGSARIYKKEDDRTWLQLGSAIRAENPGEFFGWSLSLGFDTSLRVAIGGPVYETETGLLRVYEMVGTDWVQVGNTLEGSRTMQRFGESCALSRDGKVLAVGVRGSAFGPGEVHIYREIDGTWVEEQDVLRSSISRPGDGFGSSLTMTPDGGTIVVGAPGIYESNKERGRIEVFKFNGIVWTKQGSDILGEENARYGTAVSVSGDGRRVAGGAPGGDYDGSVAETGYIQVYDRDT